MEKNTRLFAGCWLAIVTTAFGFIVRAFLIDTWGDMYNLTETQKGALQGAGLFPFALSIILVSLFVDKIGYGKAMAGAWIGHVTSAIITMTAHSYTQLYVGTFLFALSNGIVEAVANPVVATQFAKEKVKYLNILHSGWSGGLVLGGLLFIAIGGASWQIKIGLFLLPAVIYGIMLLGCKFPVNERVTAGISYMDMLKEFGWGGALIVSYFLAGAVGAIMSGMFNADLPSMAFWVIVAIPPIIMLVAVRSFGRPLFAFLLLIMVALATTELGTDSWVSDILKPVLGGNGLYVLIYTSFIMTVLRIVGGGPLAKKLSPVGLMTVCSCLAALGLYLLAGAGTSLAFVFVAATLYGVGKSFFWPTMLGIASEQFPKGGALTLNAVGGMGMIAVGVFGAPFLGAIQDNRLDKAVMDAQPAIHKTIVMPEQTFPIIRDTKIGLTYSPIDKEKEARLAPADKATIDGIIGSNKQQSLAQFAIFPVIMAVGFGMILAYFASKGGYKAVDIGAGAKAGAH